MVRKIKGEKIKRSKNKNKENKSDAYTIYLPEVKCQENGEGQGGGRTGWGKHRVEEGQSRGRTQCRKDIVLEGH